MIRLAGREDLEALARGCRYAPVLGSQIYANFQLYGDKYPFCTSWICWAGSDPVGAVGCFYGSFRVSIQADQPLEELLELLKLLGARQIEADQPVAGWLLSQLGGSLYRSAAMIRRGMPPIPPDSPFLLPKAGIELEEAPGVQVVYDLLKAGYPYFASHTVYDRWYCDTSHRLRHGGAKLWLLKKDGQPAATGGIYALSPDFAVVGGISTRPELLGQGYASRITACCVNQAAAWGKTPVLMCSEPGLTRLYSRLGFTLLGEWGSLSLGETEEG